MPYTINTYRVNIRRKCNLRPFQLLLFTRTHGDLFRYAEQQQRYNPAIPSLPWYLAPSQEFVLREIILESVIPLPFDIKAIHKRPLDASFYGGPITATYSSDDANIVLSRGNVHRLLNGHWMLCEDGCVDCEPCAIQGNPLFKWILRRIKRPSVSDPSRHDFQLTIISQTNDHFRTSFWPNSYIYATPQGERGSISITRMQHDNGSENSLPNLENSFSQQHHRSQDLWRLTERDSISQEKNHIQGNTSTDKSLEQKHRFRNMGHRPRPVEKVTEEANQLAPKLILGRDQRGQKHLIHVVPVDHPPINVAHFAPNLSISSHFVADQATRLNNTFPKHEKQIYQRIFRRVFDSLNTHRQSIESFLESPANNISEQRIASSMDSMEVAGFVWNNRDINHTNANFEPLRHNDTLLSPFYVENENEMEKYQQYKNSHGYQRKNPDVNNYYVRYPNMNQTKISHDQVPINFDFDKERRRARVRPYFINNKNISKTNSSLLLQNSSADAIPKIGFNNSFIINSMKQIDPNATFVDKANTESSSITIE